VAKLFFIRSRLKYIDSVKITGKQSVGSYFSTQNGKEILQSLRIAEFTEFFYTGSENFCPFKTFV